MREFRAGVHERVPSETTLLIVLRRSSITPASPNAIKPIVPGSGTALFWTLTENAALARRF